MIILSSRVSAKLKIDAGNGIIISDDLDGIHSNDIFVGFGGMGRQRMNNPGKKIFSCETGFFYDTCHLDAHGLYDRSSLCRPDIEDRIFSLAHEGWMDSLLALEDNIRNGQSKYQQPEDQVPIEDFVLIPAQRPKDNQIKSVSDKIFGRDYFAFLGHVLELCSDMGRQFVIKKHPMSSPEEDSKMSSMAAMYGGLYGSFSMKSCMENCERVVAYNSTVIVDAMFYNKPIVMMAPGYFSHCKSCITFCTSDDIFTSIFANMASRRKLLSFLGNAYCIPRGSPSALVAALTGERSWD
jgi:hypothetical protein